MGDRGTVAVPGMLHSARRWLPHLGYGEQRPSGNGVPGTYVCYELDLDPRTGVRNYDFRVFEDASRPVIDRIIEVLREPDVGVNAQ